MIENVQGFTLILLAAVILGYLNENLLKHRLKLPMMMAVLFISAGIVAVTRTLDVLGVLHISDEVIQFAAGIHYDEWILDILLPGLLFAAALHVELDRLLEVKWTVGLLAIVGVLFQTVVLGVGAYYLLDAFGYQLPFLAALLLGTLISATDPIAVQEVLKVAPIPASLKMKIEGESLINDGVAVVLFVPIYAAAFATAAHPVELTLPYFAKVFATEAGGGVLLGALIGYIGYNALKRIDHPGLEVGITLCMVLVGISAAHLLHASAPLAMVVAGLATGNHGRHFAMSDVTRRHVDSFWHNLDINANLFLFMLVGTSAMLVKPVNAGFGLLVVSLLFFVMTVGIRFVTVWSAFRVQRFAREFPPKSTKILTLAGVRGGVSIALALSLPAGPERILILEITYVVVVLSLLLSLSLSKLDSEVSQA